MKYIYTYVCYLLGEISGSGKRVPYSKLSSLGITVSGLPDSVSSLKRPSSYGRRQLQAIVDNKHRLKFGSKCLSFLYIVTCFDNLLAYRYNKTISSNP